MEVVGGLMLRNALWPFQYLSRGLRHLGLIGRRAVLDSRRFGQGDWSSGFEVEGYEILGVCGM